MGRHPKRTQQDVQRSWSGCARDCHSACQSQNFLIAFAGTLRGPLALLRVFREGTLFAAVHNGSANKRMTNLRMKHLPWSHDRAEFVADGVIHVVGVLLGFAGATALIIFMFWRADIPIAIATSVYALTLVTTLSMSAIYNLWPAGPVKWRLRKYDHAAIYLLIAGTYTPFALRMEANGTSLLIIVWGVAAIGMALKIAFPWRFDRLAILLYLGLGWSGLALFKTMFASLSPAVIALLLLGGAVYSVGVVFHLWRSLRFQNAIWHAFVLGGAIVHYSAVIAMV